MSRMLVFDLFSLFAASDHVEAATPAEAAIWLAVVGLWLAGVGLAVYRKVRLSR